VLGALVIVAAAVVGVPALVDRSGSSRSTATTVAPSVAKLRREIDRRLAVSGAPVPRSTALEVLRTGLDRLLRLPAIALSYTSEGTAAGHGSATGVVVPASRSLDLQLTTSLDNGAVVNEQRRVVNNTLFVRVIDRAGPGVTAPWDSTPVSAEPQSDFDSVLTGGGDANGSTAELLDLLATAPFAVTRLPGSAARYRFVLSARAVEADLAAKGGPPAGTPAAYPTSVVDFTIGPDLVLTDLSAYGTVFDEQEPIGPAVIDIHYHPTTAQPIEPPPPNEMRR